MLGGSDLRAVFCDDGEEYIDENGDVHTFILELGGVGPSNSDVLVLGENRDVDCWRRCRGGRVRREGCVCLGILLPGAFLTFGSDLPNKCAQRPPRPLYQT